MERRRRLIPPLGHPLLIGAACLILLTVMRIDPVQARIGDAEVRPAAVAGRFYPEDAGQLARALIAFMEDARPVMSPRPIAIMAPHAGYIYSGQIAADAYRQAVGHAYDLVVILGTNHTLHGFEGVSVYTGGGYRTPLGIAEIDSAVAAALVASADDFRYEPAVHEREHSVEVQVPFVQQLFPAVPIVTAVIGQPDLDLCRRFGQALARVVRDRQALIIASSDLAHYPDYDDAVIADQRTLTAMAGLDPAALQAAIHSQMGKQVPELSTCACGEAPILAAMVAAIELGANRGTVVSYANSGDAAVGAPDRVVGYGAVTWSRGGGTTWNRGEDGIDIAALERANPPTEVAPIVEGSQQLLLAFARRTIERYLSTGTTPLARDFPLTLCRRQGAFVTLKRDGRLRGCIGHMAEDSPLCRVVGAMALQAAFNDQRFAPLTTEELGSVQLEISVLTPFHPISGPEAIVVGRDGVVLRKAGRSAVYLPHVAVEQGWDRDTMLDHLAEKAGLAAGDWREGAEFHTFQAQVFAESDRHGTEPIH